jgi:hypothetical protein
MSRPIIKIKKCSYYNTKIEEIMFVLLNFSGGTFGSSGGSMFGQSGATSPGPFSAGVPAGASPFQRTPGAAFGAPASPANPSQVFGGKSYSYHI